MEENGKSDGFKFAITLFATAGTLSYALFNYFQETSVDLYSYKLYVGIFTIILVDLIFIFLYVFIKGYSFELKSKDVLLKEKLNNFSSILYMAAFLVFLFLSIIYFFIIGLVYLKIEITNNAAVLISIFSTIIAFYLAWRLIPEQSISKKLNLIGSIIILGGLLWLFLYSPALNSPLQGDVLVDMESIYYKNDTPIIPVSINTDFQTALNRHNSL